MCTQQVVQYFGTWQLLHFSNILCENLQTLLRVNIQNPTSKVQYQIDMVLALIKKKKKK